jgi:hypothetical protein
MRDSAMLSYKSNVDLEMIRLRQRPGAVSPNVMASPSNSGEWPDDL